MSPKEEATAVQLLVEWMRVTGPDVAGKLTFEQFTAHVLKLRGKTQGFIDHEDPDA